MRSRVLAVALVTLAALGQAGRIAAQQDDLPPPMLGEPPEARAGLAGRVGAKGVPRVVALKELIVSALDKNLEIKAQSLAINASHRAVEGAKAEQTPVLSLTSTLRDTNEDHRFEPLGAVGQFLADIADDHALLTGAVVKVPIYHGDTLAALPRAAKVQESIEILRREALRQDVILRLVELYADALFNAKQLDLATERKKKKEADLKVMQEREKNAVVLKQQVLAAQLDIDEIDQEVLELSNQALVLRERLARTAFLPRGPIELAPQIGMADLTASVDDVVKTARTRNPRIKALLRGVDLASEQLAIARGKDAATVDLSVDYLHHQEFPRPEHNADTYLAMLTWNYDVLDFGRRDSEQGEKRERRSKAAVEVEDATVKLETDIRQVYNAYTEAQKLLGRSERNIELARENLRTVQEKYDANILLETDLLEARVNEKKALVNRDRVLTSIIKARARLFALMGTLAADLF